MNNSHCGAKPEPLSWEELGAACFWISVKADGSRACLPSRTLLERASNISAHMLSAIELVRVGEKLRNKSTRFSTFVACLRV